MQAQPSQLEALFHKQQPDVIEIDESKLAQCEPTQKLKLLNSLSKSNKKLKNILSEREGSTGRGADLGG